MEKLKAHMKKSRDYIIRSTYFLEPVEKNGKKLCYINNINIYEKVKKYNKTNNTHNPNLSNNIEKSNN